MPGFCPAQRNHPMTKRFTPAQARAIRARILRALRAGRTVSHAARACGIAFGTLYAWRHARPEFAAAWQAARDAGALVLLDRARALPLTLDLPRGNGQRALRHSAEA